MKECIYRKFELTDGCGGAGYWWCYNPEINTQINIYKDCKDCKLQQYSDGSNWNQLVEVIKK